MIRERLIELIDYNGSSPRKRFSEFSDKTGINRDTIKQFYHGNQNLSDKQLDAVNTAFPEYVFWIATGNVLPDSGQISPAMENEEGRDIAAAQ